MSSFRHLHRTIPAVMLLSATGLVQAAGTASISREEVLAAQQAWADGIVRIGQVMQQDGDYRAAAREHIETLYAYELTPVLFKPTKAAEDPFRGSFDEAMSYFVGGIIDEDSGFAINPWTAVRFDNEGIITDRDSALAMGEYYFTTLEGQEVKVEYTLGYVKDEEGQLRINLHHSSLPFQP